MFLVCVCVKKHAWTYTLYVLSVSLFMVFVDVKHLIFYFIFLRTSFGLRCNVLVRHASPPGSATVVT